ncbi:hypothetical protein KM043_015806 [Ampulex compressa]|nr:hypothetical protein KM043_015806 [Ampulex compressa]
METDIEVKIKELKELFTRTKEQLREIVEESERFLSQEIQCADEVDQNISEVYVRNQSELLRDVESIYKGRRGICKGKGLRATETNWSEPISVTKTRKNAARQIAETSFRARDKTGIEVLERAGTSRQHERISGPPKMR